MEAIESIEDRKHGRHKNHIRHKEKKRHRSHEAMEAKEIIEGKFANQQRLKIANLGFFNNNDKCLRTESYSKVILVK